jgi:hypothetical protein
MVRSHQNLRTVWSAQKCDLKAIVLLLCLVRLWLKKLGSYTILVEIYKKLILTDWALEFLHFKFCAETCMFKK